MFHTEAPSPSQPLSINPIRSIRGTLRVNAKSDLVCFLRNFQKTEYRSAVLFFLMLLFAIAAHWLACIFHFIAILERPNLQVKYSWLDHLADKYKMPYRMLIFQKEKIF